MQLLENKECIKVQKFDKNLKIFLVIKILYTRSIHWKHFWVKVNLVW